MPDFGSATFSQTDASNATGTMPSWSGAAAPSTLDDAGRALQGAVTREWNWRSYTLTAGGTSDAKTLTYSVAPAAHYNGQRFAFIANTTNTTTATLNVNSLGAKTIKKDVSGTLTNLTASEMVSGMFIEVAYNTANDCFVWVNRGIDAFPAGSVSAPSITTNGDTNTGFWFPAADTIAASTGGAERWRVDSTGLGVNGAAAATFNVFSAAATTAQFRVTGGSSGSPQAVLYGYASGVSGANGAGIGAGFISGGYGPLLLETSGTIRLSINASGDILNVSTGGLGYGTGSGGTVTQITSKGTSVTLNKTNGAITTNNSALAGGGTATFTVTNSTMAASDTVIINVTNGNYSGRVYNNAAGSFIVALKNETGGSLTDAVQINFAIIKAVTS
jgi:hypothetical protein